MKKPSKYVKGEASTRTLKRFKEFTEERRRLHEEERDWPTLRPRDVMRKHQPGIYSAHVEHGSGKKKVKDYHEVHANSHQEATNIIAKRHAEKHGLRPHQMNYAVSTQYHGEKKMPHSPPPKPPHRDSAEQRARDEMQRRYDSLGYKGD